MAREYLGEFEHLVLLAVLRLADDAYGVPIRREITLRTRRELTVGSLYATLDRLESKGLLKSRTGDATPERGGRAKRYFRVTAAGLRMLKESRQVSNAMWEGLEAYGA